MNMNLENYDQYPEQETEESSCKQQQRNHPGGDNPFACQQTYSGYQEYRCCMSANLSDNL